MPDSKRKKLRFSDVAYGVGATPKALRKMLQNTNLTLPGPAAAGWTEFSPVQVAVIALSRRFIEFGQSVQSATTGACLLLLGSVADGKGTTGLTAASFLQLLSKSFAFLYFDEGIHKTVLRTGRRCPPIPSFLKSFPVLIVPVGEVVRRAFDRVGVDPLEDMSDSDISIAQTLLRLRVEIIGSSKDLAPIKADMAKAAQKRRRKDE